MMSLKSICQQQLVDLIKNLPPLLKEELIEESLIKIKEEYEEKAHKKIIDKLQTELPLKISMITRNLIKDYNEGKEYKRKKDYTIDSFCHQIAYTFIEDNYHNLVDTDYLYVNRCMEEENSYIDPYISEGDSEDNSEYY